MKRIIIMATCIASAVMLASCGGKSTGTANEVLSKKAFSAVIAKYENVGDFYDGVAVVSMGRNNYGLIDNKGKEIVACNYKYIENSSCGMVKFRDDSGYGFMNTKGEMVVESGKYENIADFTDNLACVEKDDLWGYIDNKGNEVIPCTFDRAYGFSEGLALVLKSNKYGYVNTKGEFVVAPSYDDGEHFSCGVAITSKGKKEYVINSEGTVVFSIDNDKSVFLEEHYSDNLIPVLKEQGRKMVVGFINTKGEEAIPFEYQYALGFIDGTALAMKDNKVYTINTKGEILGEETSTDILMNFLEEAEYFCEFTDDVLIKLLGEELYEEEWY